MIFINKSFKDNILSKVHKLSSIPIELSLLIDDGFIVHNNGCVFLKLNNLSMLIMGIF